MGKSHGRTVLETIRITVMLLKSAMVTFRAVCAVLKVGFAAALGVIVYQSINGFMPEWAAIIVASVFGGNLGPVLADMALTLGARSRRRENRS